MTEADHLADVRIEGATGKVLPKLCELLGVALDVQNFVLLVTALYR